MTQFLICWINWTLSKSKECPEWRKWYWRPVLFFTFWWTAWESKAFWQEAKCSFVLVPSFWFVPSPLSSSLYNSKTNTNICVQHIFMKIWYFRVIPWMNYLMFFFVFHLCHHLHHLCHQTLKTHFFCVKTFFFLNMLRVFYAICNICRISASSSSDWYFVLTIDLVISVLNNLFTVLLVVSFSAGK